MERTLRITILCGPNGETGTSLIEFPNPTLVAIDFGNLSTMREEPRELKVEIDFEHIIIDGIDFQF